MSTVRTAAAGTMRKLAMAFVLVAVSTDCSREDSHARDSSSSDPDVQDMDSPVWDGGLWTDPNTLPDGAPNPCLGRTVCRECNSVEPCGWCNTTGRCLAGTPTGSFDGTCAGDPWFWREVQCPGSGTLCPTRTTCSACMTVYDWCGWCANIGQCIRGDRHGPLQPIEGCSPAAGTWIYHPETQTCP